MSTFELTTASAPIPHLPTTDVHFRRVLLAIDFSAQTSQLLRAGIQIARDFHSELFLVHAAGPAGYTTAGPSPMASSDVALEIAQALMSELVSTHRELATIPHRKIVAYAGTPLELIQQVIEDKRIDLVIAGSHGARGVERLVLGSVAESVLRTVRCPVLVIGPQATIPTHLFSSILLASRLDMAGLRSAQYATALAERFHSKLMMLHVVEPIRFLEPIEPELFEDRITDQLQELVPHQFSVHARAIARVEFGKARDLIASIALYSHSTLVVTGVPCRRPLADHMPRATLCEAIRRSRCPVLSVPGYMV